MATERRTNIKLSLRNRLIREAGGKCANPGCPVRLSQIHHIEEWHIYHTHNPKEMIAICASCHDEVHRGALSISDDDLYRWKRIRREGTRHDVLSIEPGIHPKLLLGSVAFTGDSGIVFFDLSSQNRLVLSLRDGDLYFLNTAVSDANGVELIKIVENQVKYTTEPLTYERRQGKFVASVPISDDFLPIWALEQMRRQEPGFAADGRLRVLAAEVIEPGLVQIEGIWRGEDGNFIVISRERLAFVRPGSIQPISFIGEGVGSQIIYTGAITKVLFGFAKANSVAI